MDDQGLNFENQARRNGARHVAGVDEVGRGPLAGPVVAAAVLLPAGFSSVGINDSKKLSARQRMVAFERICRQAAGIGVGVIDAEVIDRINILEASLLAMATAIDRLDPAPDYLLVDGKQPVKRAIPQLTLTRGDSRSLSIAAASIVAKVTRDRLMEDYHRLYPAYGFDQHKGYPTRAHREAVAVYGGCPIHRRSFKGVPAA
ncbi:MAG: ribonuclease HII [Desulfobacterales bacterium]|nr:ribonuclease HII [Desulfobacterales bacterium]